MSQPRRRPNSAAEGDFQRRQASTSQRPRRGTTSSAHPSPSDGDDGPPAGRRRPARANTVPGFVSPDKLAGDRLRLFICQAVGSVLEDPEGVLQTTLRDAGLDQLPEDTGHLARFVFEPLRTRIEQLAGPEASRHVVRSITALLRSRSELERGARPPGRRPSSQPPPTGSVPPTAPVVLVAVDNPRLRAQIIALARGQQCRAVAAPDITLALAMCMRQKPDVVIAEEDMPEGGAERLAALLEVAFAAEAPPVVLLTEDEAAGGGDAPKSSHQRVAAIVPRPVQESRFIDALGDALDQAPPRADED